MQNSLANKRTVVSILTDGIGEGYKLSWLNIFLLMFVEKVIRFVFALDK